MKCQYCGSEVSDKLIFCSCCGTRLEVPAVVPAAQPEIREKDGAVEQTAPFPEVTEQEALREFPRIQVRRDVPVLRLPVKRSLVKMVFLGLLTLGIYPAVIWSRIVTELNLTASRHDGKRTMPFFAMVPLSVVTLGIFSFVWMHRFCRRVENELKRRSIPYAFGAKTFWWWNVLGSLILAGPFVFLHRLIRAMNLINEDYNFAG